MLKRLLLTNFRNYPQFEFCPSSRITVITGHNGSGKTSLLESIYTLSTGRSFRTSKLSSMIHNQAGFFSLFAEIDCVSSGTHKLGMRRDHKGINSLRIDERRPRGLSELAFLLPVQVFHPTSADLVYGDASYRRAFLDWGLFHVEQSFLPAWRQFQQVLAHRNSLLKSGGVSDASLDTWDRQLLLVSARIDGLRKAYLEDLVLRLKRTERPFDLDIDYYPGWSQGESLQESLGKHRQVDKERGFTSVGPHRADIKLRTKQGLCRDVMSRGQCKLLSYQLLLTQVQSHLEVRPECMLLIDDFDSEIDSIARSALIGSLLDLNQQVFVTTLNPQKLMDLVPHNAKRNEMGVFHVEHKTC